VNKRTISSVHYQNIGSNCISEFDISVPFELIGYAISHIYNHFLAVKLVVIKYMRKSNLHNNWNDF